MNYYMKHNKLTSTLITFLLVVSTLLHCSYAAIDKMDTDFFDVPEVKVDLLHSFGHAQGDGMLSPRGSVHIRNFRGPKYTTEQKDLLSVDLEMLQALAAEDGYYFLTAKIKLPSVEKEFKTFTPARSLLDSGLFDNIRIHLAPSGEIFSMSYGVRQNNQRAESLPLRFNTTVTVHNGEFGPIPDTAPYLEKLEMERIAKERGEDGRDNRSFIAKYWMYIVPVALLVLLSSASGQEGGS